MIVGHGIDIVSVARIERMLNHHADRFLERVFTPVERSHGQDTRRYAEHLAARFAAKEAVFKALGTGWRDGLGWVEIGVVSDALGKPTLHLTGRALIVAKQLGIDRWWLSLTHTEGMAVASAIAETGVTRSRENPGSQA